ncbi:A/G-specific adenine glycosylase [Ureibacillus acetophenoni]|uniref:Adenine DNA glycosylase n=1 Tax=Ureibacillus acetophenoni TaxID=614649 RepID=A0A285UQH9_9BACL|nr:A/G-specific adenine glycosylase [Ureibacillus acetophenoni]SOC44013.1 A/G-specific DNA-adenine glycosylase [Ureibacillus acetophenoni]
MKYPYKNEFTSNLVEWYHGEKRDLPWRRTNDPYKIWVSEVMLQQTRVDTVIPYYNRFLEKYPTPQSLAYAPQEELLKMWEGLGYYSRARNLQSGVREVVEKYDGQVPNNRHDLSKLKGIGPYTAGAILSIAFNEPEHAVDGNVMRVLSRVLHIKEDIAVTKTKKIFEEAVMDLIDQDDPGAFNQGLMDLGAQICTPTSPKCLLCPVREYCMAFQEGHPEELPIKSKKTKSKTIQYNVFVIKDGNGHYLVEKRPDEGLLASMWQFPMLEKLKNQSSEKIYEALENNYNVKLKGNLDNPILEFKHIFSHLTWEMAYYLVEAEHEGDRSEICGFYSLEEIGQLPMSVPMLKVLNSLK